MMKDIKVRVEIEDWDYMSWNTVLLPLFLSYPPGYLWLPVSIKVKKYMKVIMVIEQWEYGKKNSAFVFVPFLSTWLLMATCVEKYDLWYTGEHENRRLWLNVKKYNSCVSNSFPSTCLLVATCDNNNDEWYKGKYENRRVKTCQETQYFVPAPFPPTWLPEATCDCKGDEVLKGE